MTTTKKALKHFNDTIDESDPTPGPLREDYMDMAIEFVDLYKSIIATSLTTQINVDTIKSNPETLAIKFHETYEALAPEFGYKTREESAKPWSEVPKQNKDLMVEVCKEIIKYIESSTSIKEPEQKKLYAHCYRTGKIVFMTTDKHPDTLTLCSGYGEEFINRVSVLARLAYDNETLLVPGVPEAADDEEAYQAVDKFREYYHSDKGH